MMPPPFPPLQAQIEKIKAEPLQKPCATVYVQNLNERIKSSDIKDSLFQLFSNVGEVHDVHAHLEVGPGLAGVHRGRVELWSDDGCSW